MPKNIHKIVRVITRLAIGGPAIHTALLTHELPARGYPSVLVAGDCEPGEGDMSYLFDATDPIRRVPELSRSVSPARNLRALWRLWRLLRAERPTIVHTHTAMAGCIGRTAAILAGVPVVVHTFHGNSLRQYFSPIKNAVFLAVERVLARGTDAICVLSRQQLNELASDLRIAPRSKFRIVPLGLDLAPYLDIPLPSPSGRIRVGWFGRVVRVKNIGLLLDIVASAQKTNQPFEFHVIGDGPEGYRIAEAAPRLASHLTWHGWQQDMAPFVAACDVVVQTSCNEGTPVALIQGMAGGRPFLSTAAGGVVDMTCGEPRSLTPGAAWFDNGALVEAQADAFVAALAELARSPERVVEMGRAARLFSSAHYCKEALIANLDSLYRELMEDKLPEMQPARQALSSQA